MDLDTLSKVIEKNEIAFNDLVRRYASDISLKDIIKELENDDSL